MSDRKIESYANTSVNSYEIKVNDVTKILNKEKTSYLGKWVKIENYVEKKPEYSADGEFRTDKNGNIRYWANSLVKNKALIPESTVTLYLKFMEGYQYQPDDTYDWGSELIAQDSYLKDMLVKIDGDYYHFNKKGYADRNTWVNLGTENYFDHTGKRVTNDWVMKDGKLYHVDQSGEIQKNCWIDDTFTTYYTATQKKAADFKKLKASVKYK